MADFSDVVKQLQNNQEQNRKSLSNVNSNIAYQNNQLRELIGEQGKLVTATEATTKAVKDEGKKSKDAQKGLLDGVGSIIKKDVGGGLQKVTSSITGPMEAFANAIPGLNSMGRVLKQIGGNAVSGAKLTEEKRQKERADKRQESLLQTMVKGIWRIGNNLIDMANEKAGMGLGAVAGLIAAPVIALASFFKTLGSEIKLLMSFTKGGRLARIFGAFGDVIRSISNAVKAIGTRGLRGAGKIAEMFGKFVGFIGKTLGMVGRVFGSMFRFAGRLFGFFVRTGKIIGGFMKSFSFIARFARGFGTILGKIFLPITFLIGVWDTLVGAFEGWMSSDSTTLVGTFVDSIGGGISNLVANLIGYPLNLITAGIAWIGGLFGLDTSGLKNLDFVASVKKLVKYPFDLIQKGIDWIAEKFNWETIKATAASLWTTALGTFTDVSSIFMGAVTGAVTWIKGLFAWGGDLVAEGWTNLNTFVSSVWTGVKTWFTDKFTFASDTVSEGWTNLKDAVLGVFGGIKTWFTDKFTFASDTVSEGWTNLKDKVLGVFGSVKEWFTGLFSWNGVPEGETGFSLWQTVKDGLSKIWGWVSGLFQIDVGSVIKDFIPNWVMKWLPDSLFSGSIPETEPEVRAMGGPVQVGKSYLVGEVGPELFVPKSDGNIISNADLARMRTAAVAEGSTQREDTMRYSSPTIINNAPTTNNISGSGGGSRSSIIPMRVGDNDPTFRAIAANAF